MGLSNKRFGGPAKAVGQSILIDNVPFTVAGVTPPEFFGVDPAEAPDFYLPMHTNLLLDGATSWAPTPPHYLDQNYYWIEMMGRLRPGVSLVQAQAALAPPFHQWVAATATSERERANLPTLLLQEGAGGLDNLRRQYSKPLYMLLTMVGLILAIACANTANLLLAKAAARKARNGGAAQSGRWAHPCVAATSHRECRAGVYWRVDGHSVRRLGRALPDFSAGQRKRELHITRGVKLARPWGGPCTFAVERHAVWAGAGDPVDPD